MDYILSIAASDSSGGAGVQNDERVAWHLKKWLLTALTGVTAQDFNGLTGLEATSAEMFGLQLKTNLDSFRIKAIKIGALCSGQQVDELCNFLQDIKVPIVLDPVLKPTKGKQEFLRAGDYSSLLARVNVVTPNKYELEQFTGRHIDGFPEAVIAAKWLSSETSTAVYVKGGHFQGRLAECLITPETEYYFTKKRQNFPYNHGTGCAFSTALACYLGDGLPLFKAARKASLFVTSYYKRLNVLLSRS